MARRGSEKWDLLNIPVEFPCYPRAFRAAAAIARARNIGIVIRHHGPRPELNDRTRVNHYVHPDGTRTWKEDEHGNLIDVG